MNINSSEMPSSFVDAIGSLVIDSEGDGVNYRRDITLRDALGEPTVGDIACEAWAVADITRAVRSGHMVHLVIGSGHVSFAKVAQQDFITVLSAGEGSR